eukprot:403368233
MENSNPQNLSNSQDLNQKLENDQLVLRQGVQQDAQREDLSQSNPHIDKNSDFNQVSLQIESDEQDFGQKQSTEMIVDESLRDGTQNHDEEIDVSYRLVNRKFFCYLCQREFSKMVAPDDILTCDQCHEGFCEIIEKPRSMLAIQGNDGAASNLDQNVDEEKRRANEQYRIVFENQAAANAHNRLDIHNRSTQNLYGEPETTAQLRRREQQMKQEEEKKQSFNQQQQRRAQQQPQQQQRQGVGRGGQFQQLSNRQNPFRGTAGSNFIDNFFTGSPFFMGFGAGPSASRPQSQLFRDPFGSSMMNEDQFLGQFFRPFSFGQIFDDDQFTGFNSSFDFNPNVFATNFSQNFRSFGNMDDILQRVIDMSAQQQQEHKKPTKKEAIQKIPVVNISEKHCKKKDGSEEVETPLCTICQENLPIGEKAMIIPCGHIFHPDCVLPWLKDHNTCPVCRYELPSDAQ